MEAFDSDGDGTVDSQEFLAVIKSRKDVVRMRKLSVAMMGIGSLKTNVNLDKKRSGFASFQKATTSIPLSAKSEFVRNKTKKGVEHGVAAQPDAPAGTPSNTRLPAAFTAKLVTKPSAPPDQPSPALTDPGIEPYQGHGAAAAGVARGDARFRTRGAGVITSIGEETHAANGSTAANGPTATDGLSAADGPAAEMVAAHGAALAKTPNNAAPSASGTQPAERAGLRSIFLRSALDSGVSHSSVEPGSDALRAQALLSASNAPGSSELASIVPAGPESVGTFRLSNRALQKAYSDLQLMSDLSKRAWKYFSHPSMLLSSIQAPLIHPCASHPLMRLSSIHALLIHPCSSHPCMFT